MDVESPNDFRTHAGDGAERNCDTYLWRVGRLGRDIVTRLKISYESCSEGSNIVRFGLVGFTGRAGSAYP
jgi:hypothetical protein